MTTDLKGEATFIISNAPVGSYNLVFVTQETDVYKPGVKELNIIVQHRITLDFTVEYRVLENGSILFILKTILQIDGQPFPGQEIKYYLKGSWIFIGSNTTDENGVSILYYIVNQTGVSNTYTFKAEYISSSIYISSIEKTVSVTVTLPPEYWTPPPAPEHPLTPLILLTLLLLYVCLRIKTRRSRGTP